MKKEGIPMNYGPDEKDHDKVTGHKTGSNIAEENRVDPEAWDKRSFIKEKPISFPEKNIRIINYLEEITKSKLQLWIY